MREQMREAFVVGWVVQSLGPIIDPPDIAFLNLMRQRTSIVLEREQRRARHARVRIQMDVHCLGSVLRR